MEAYLEVLQIVKGRLEDLGGPTGDKTQKVFEPWEQGRVLCYSLTHLLSLFTMRHLSALLLYLCFSHIEML